MHDHFRQNGFDRAEAGGRDHAHRGERRSQEGDARRAELKRLKAEHAPILTRTKLPIGRGAEQKVPLTKRTASLPSPSRCTTGSASSGDAAATIS